MRVAFVSAEVHPFIKTGGLADVAHSLPSALTSLGIETTVFVPYYRQVKQWVATNGEALEAVNEDRRVRVGDIDHLVAYHRLAWQGRRVVFVVHDGFYDRAHPYLDSTGADYPDSVARWAFFCRAVLAYYGAVEPPADVMHVNDWQAGLLPVYLRTTEPGSSATLLTIHNLAYQGLFPAERLAETGLPADLMRPDGLEFFGKLNLLKGGIVFADAVNAVSPTYAEEIQTEEYGKGLQGVLQSQRAKLCGILNGIDTVEWDPASDRHLAAHYSATDLAGKARNKETLQRRMGLPAKPQAFLLGVISRFDAQKGIHLITEAFAQLADLEAQLVILGSGDAKIQAAVEALVHAQPGRAAAMIGFDEALAHQIEAGGDAFLMPSAFEPCGLNQMYSQRYGTVPIVRQTGGLKDTVVDATAATIADGSASGFSFRDFDTASLAATIRRAAQMYGGDRKAWLRLVGSIMGLDRSWGASARTYADLYVRLARNRSK